MRSSVLSGILFAFLFAPALSQENLLTVAEATDFASTSRYEDVMRFIGKLEAMSPYIRTEIMGRTVEGRNIPLMVIADPMPLSPSDLKNDPRLVVYVQANIHAGEVEGKEAVLMFARDILGKNDPALFREVVFLACPIFNADGNERISEENRAHQAGPENGVGVRHNAQMLDLNRDAMKAETPEMRGLISHVFNRWDPAVIMDCHTTNGVYRQEPVTFSWMVNPNGDRELIRYMRDKMMPAMSRNLLENFDVENTFYGEFMDMSNPDEGYTAYASEPRYLVNYIGLRNRLAILNENYVYADFRSRVEGTYYLIQTMLDYAVENRAEIKEKVRSADARTLARGSDPAPADSFAVTYTGVPTPRKVTVKTYEVERYTDDQGRPRFRKTDNKLTLTVPYIADYEPLICVKFPYAYLITVPDPGVLSNLRVHNIEVEELSRAQSFEVERFDLQELVPSQRLNQGHYTNQVKGTFVAETRTFPAGTCLVRTAQPLGSLAAYLLEPQSNDGLLLWNFFDSYLVPQWGRGFYPYPVYKVLGKTKILSKGLGE